MGKMPLGTQFTLEIRNTGKNGFTRWEVTTIPHHAGINADIQARLPTFLSSKEQLQTEDTNLVIRVDPPRSDCSEPRISQKLTNVTIDDNNLSHLYNLARQGYKDIVTSNTAFDKAVTNGALEMEAGKIATAVIQNPRLFGAMQVRLMNGSMCPCGTHIDFDDDNEEMMSLLQDIPLEDLPAELFASAPPGIREMLDRGNFKAKVLDLSSLLSALSRRPSRQTNPTLTFRFLDEGGALAASPFAQVMEKKVKDLAVQAVREAIPHILDKNEQFVIANAAQIEDNRARLMAENDDDMRQMLAYRKTLAAHGLVTNEPTAEFATFVKSRTPVAPDLNETPAPATQPRRSPTPGRSAAKAS